MIRILRAADRVATPWKNGGGVTREVAIWPEDAGFDNFDWRVSIAEVRSDGPFSKFANIDRLMLILKGRLVLTVEDRDVELLPGSSPFAFPGDVPCSGTPQGGAVTDLNIMTRRGRWTADVQYATKSVFAPAKGQMLIVTPAPTIVAIETQSYELQSLDAVLVNEAANTEIAASGPLFAITLMQV